MHGRFWNTLGPDVSLYSHKHVCVQPPARSVRLLPRQKIIEGIGKLWRIIGGTNTTL